MKLHTYSLLAVSLLSLSLVQAEPGVVTQLQKLYASQGATSADAARGQALWNTSYTIKGQKRSCTSCHTDDLAAAGKHLRTGKPIKAMAPTVNPERLSNQSKIEKWFKRNCKWTLGRECSAQEKADLLTYIDRYSISI
jgi:hypothetical protein